MVLYHSSRITLIIVNRIVYNFYKWVQSISRIYKYMFISVLGVLFIGCIFI